MIGDTEMLGYLIQIEQTKIFKRLILWTEMGLLCGYFLLYYVGSVLASLKPGVAIGTSTSPSLISIVTWPRSLIDILTFISGNNLGGIVLVVFVAVVVAQEYQWKTISLWLSRGTPRSLLLAARWAALLLAALLLIVVPLMVGGAVTAFLTMLINGKLDLSVVNYGQLTLGVARSLIVALPYIAFTFMMATLTRSVAGGMGAGIGFMVVTEGVLPLLLLSIGAGKAVLYLPGMLSKNLLQLNSAIANTSLAASSSPDAGQASALADPTAAAVGLVLYAVVFLGIAFYRFQRQDLSA
jgi:ABC-type transport system involved in multi-copper enzyme maturation permease subunit